MHPTDIVLLQHDGFASTRRLSDKAIMEAVFQATSYRLELEEKTIRIDPDAQFLRNRNKLEIRPQPNIHAGLSLPLSVNSAVSYAVSYALFLLFPCLLALYVC